MLQIDLVDLVDVVDIGGIIHSRVQCDTSLLFMRVCKYKYIVCVRQY